MTKPMRCAIYTRKSSEEGLEQDFNSLHAQREACEAYIKSQAHAGWKQLKEPYDDGGISGGTLDRPDLTRLLADIRAGTIDIVVVYKVDRLTRSLTDFSKLVEIFDTHNVSFVSVTQSFNTTSSMGRLTLNMLLSFAQFEREVTAERIRDKIAASKKKGMWMGGTVPIGYHADGRTLAIVESDAEIIRTIYRFYLESGTVRQLKARLDGEGIYSPCRTQLSGRSIGGNPFCQGQLYKILNNPIYAGDIRHGKEIHAGKHPAIIAPDLWDQVQARLESQSVQRQSAKNIAHPSLLAGLAFDHTGDRLAPSHAVKSGIRYRYYVSRSLITGLKASHTEGWRIPAADLEELVIDQLTLFLGHQGQLLDELTPGPQTDIRSVLAKAEALVKNLKASSSAYVLIRRLITSLTVHPDHIVLEIGANALASELGLSGADKASSITLTIPTRLKRHGRAVRLLILQDGVPVQKPQVDSGLISSLQKAHRWWDQILRGGLNVTDLARMEGLASSYVSRMVRLVFLAPDITAAILSGTQSPDIKVKGLAGRSQIPVSWKQQRQALGFAG